MDGYVHIRPIRPSHMDVWTDTSTFLNTSINPSLYVQSVHSVHAPTPVYSKFARSAKIWEKLVKNKKNTKKRKKKGHFYTIIPVKCTDVRIPMYGFTFIRTWVKIVMYGCTDSQFRTFLRISEKKSVHPYIL